MGLAAAVLMAVISGLVAVFCLYEMLLLWPAIIYAGVLAGSSCFVLLGVSGARAEMAQMRNLRRTPDPIWQPLLDAEANGTRRSGRKIGLLQGLVLSLRYRFQKVDDAAIANLERLAKEREIKS